MAPREWEVLTERKLAPAPGLAEVWNSTFSGNLEELLVSPAPTEGRRDIAWAEALINASGQPLPPHLVPLMPVDERSFACVVLSGAGRRPRPDEGSVVRWHLDVKDKRHQAELLDTDCLRYVRSVEAELAARDAGLSLVLDQIGPAYREAFLARGEPPGDFAPRPVRLSCQNVIVGLAAFARDPAFDGLSVPAWQTCEVPHVAAHEANRALAALMLCDAFQGGGTMEVRFTGHPERQIPASLRRYARTAGVGLGAAGPATISPAEARELFLAVTPMPGELRDRVRKAIEAEGIAPERLCFELLAGTWHPLELDFLLATTARTASVVSGGSEWRDRGARQAESEACRAAVMSGMLFNALANHDPAGAAQSVRVLEDSRREVTWRCDPELAAVEFGGLDPALPVPWAGTDGEGYQAFTVVPRTHVTPAAFGTVRRLRERTPAALLLPLDCAVQVPGDIPVLRCPDGLADLDLAVAEKLLKSRSTHA